MPKSKFQRRKGQISADYLKSIYLLCQESSCRLMLSGRDGDSGTPELYHSFFHKYCDLLGFSDIFLSPQWIQMNNSLLQRSQPSSPPSMNGSYSRWYMAYILGGRLAPKDSDEFSLFLSSIVLVLFRNHFVGSLFQSVYCHCLIDQLSKGDAPNGQKIEDISSSPLSLMTLVTLITAVIENFYWSLRLQQFSKTILSLFQFSLALSSFVSLLFVVWVLNEVSS
jgi:hypothetical protein